MFSQPIDHISSGLRREGLGQKRMTGRVRSRPGRNIDLRAQLHEHVARQGHVMFPGVEANEVNPVGTIQNSDYC